MSAEYGIWPPQGGDASNKQWGRLLAIGQFNNGAEISDAFGNLAITVNAAGDYTVTLDAQLAGIATQVLATPSGNSAPFTADAVIATPQTVHVQLWDGTGTLADGNFTLAVYG